MKLDRAHRRTAARRTAVHRCHTDVVAEVQTVYRTTRRAGSTESPAGSATYGYLPKRRPCHAVSARADSTSIQVVPSTFYVPDPARRWRWAGGRRVRDSRGRRLSIANGRQPPRCQHLACQDAVEPISCRRRL